MGVLMRKNIPYGGGGGGGGGDNSKTVTYEQYKNLSEAEKNSDTTYFVSDYPGDLGRLSTAMSWKTIGSATGANPVVADFTKYDELLILVRVNAETTSNSVTIHILKDQLLPDKTNFFSGGSYVNTSSNVGAVIYGTTTQLQVGAAQNNGTDYKSSCEMIIYGLVYSSATSSGSPILSNELSGTSSSIVVEKGGSYTVPKDGYYCLVAKSGAQGIGANWFINGVIILTNANTEGVGVTFYLKKGTVLTTREEGNGTYAIVATPL